MHDLADIDGKCLLCRKQIEPVLPKPKHFSGVSELQLAYDYVYNPDYGGRERYDYY